VPLVVMRVGPQSVASSTEHIVVPSTAFRSVRFRPSTSSARRTLAGYPPFRLCASELSSEPAFSS
jgi:hypothetical protein